MADIDMFFMSPSIAPRRHGTFSQLYLLRRDISACFCASILWPGVMAICAGIDLLGKFLAGNDDGKKVGERFETFLKIYFKISSDDAKIIYQLRNSLLHSFGLYSEVKDRNGKVKQVYGGFCISPEIIK